MKLSRFAFLLLVVLVLLLPGCAAHDGSPVYEAMPPALDNAETPEAPAPAPDNAEAPEASAPEPPPPAEDSFDFDGDYWPDDDLFDTGMFYDPSTPYHADAPGGILAPPVQEIAPPTYTGETQGALPILTPDDSRGRQIIHTVDVTLQTTEFMDGIALLVSSVENLGGFLESSNIQGRDLDALDEARVATYVFRVHSNYLSQFIVIMETNFNLLNMTQSSADVTFQHAQGRFTLSDLRALEATALEGIDAINEILRDPDALYELSNAYITLLQEALIDLEYELHHVRVDLRNMELSQATLDETIHYSTIFVTVYEFIVPVVIPYEPEEEVVDPGFDERIGDAAATSFEGLLNALQGLLIFIINALPVLIMIAIIGIPVFLIARKIHKMTEPRRQKEKEARERGKNNAAAYYGYQSQQNQAYQAPTSHAVPYQVPEAQVQNPQTEQPQQPQNGRSQ